MLLLTASALSTVVPPQAWLSDALCSMVEHLTSRLDVLLPWNWKTRLSGTCLAGGARVRIPFAPAVSQCRGGHRECKRQEREVPQRREFLRAQPAGGVRDELAHRGDRGQARRRARGLKRRWVGVGEISDGHRWDSPPKIRFAPDSPLEERRFEPLVPPVPLVTESARKPESRSLDRCGVQDFRKDVGWSKPRPLQIAIQRHLAVVGPRLPLASESSLSWTPGEGQNRALAREISPGVSGAREGKQRCRRAAAAI